jgi:hypothetical protein
MWKSRLAIWATVLAVVGGGCQSRDASKPGTADRTATALDKTVDQKPATDEQKVVKVSVGQQQNYVNLIPDDVPPVPKFTALEKKPGMVRGFVLDPNGKPLPGAYIGVRSTFFAGRYTGASAVSDEKGYYEIKVPQGTAHFYAAGTIIDYGKGRAAIPLHPADGKLATFTVADGEVEHFVRWTYGVADREALKENPRLSSNFYGGALYIGHFTSAVDDDNAPPSNLRTGTEIEITLTPQGKLLDGSDGKTFAIRKAVSGSGFSINNIPIGQYRLTIKRADGRELRMKLNKPIGQPFGIVPGETTDSALLTLFPGGTKAELVAPGRGNWEAVEVYVEIPITK